MVRKARSFTQRGPIVKFTHYLIALSASISFTAQSSSQADHPSVCRILARNKTNQALSYICSGVLTKSDEITTAEHCADDLQAVDISVECQQQSVTSKGQVFEQTQSGNTVMTRGPQFKQSAQVVKVEIPQDNGKTYRKDLAKLKLNNPMQITPLKIATDAELNQFFPNNQQASEQAMLAEQANCLSVGYGVGSNGISGVQKVVTYPNTYLVLLREPGVNDRILGQFEFMHDGANAFTLAISELMGQINGGAIKMNEYVKELNQYFTEAMAPIEFVQPGDSGGVILCQGQGQQEYKLVGISSKFAWGESAIDEDFSKIFFQSIFERIPEKEKFIELNPKEIPLILRYHL